MIASWPLEAMHGDDAPLPPPWDGDVDINDSAIESALLTLQRSDPTRAVEVCRKAFHHALARGDKQAQVHALYMAFCSLFGASKEPHLAQAAFAIVCERAGDVSSPRLSLRIELAQATVLADNGEHAQAMVIRQRALGMAMAIGDNQLVFFILFSLANSCIDVGAVELALELLDQLQPLLREDDVLSLNMRSPRANLAALAWMEVASIRRTAGDGGGATAALSQARELAQSARDMPTSVRERLNAYATLVQVLLKCNDVSAARVQARAIDALLDAPVDPQSDLWCFRQIVSTRIDLHDGSASEDTLNTLKLVEQLQRLNRAPGVYESEIQQALFRTYERLGKLEQALRQHERWTHSHEQRQGLQSRQRIKVLRHTVFAMRAEAVEFIAHDLRTPLAAAQTWMQTLSCEALPGDAASPARSAQRLLHEALLLCDQYLGALRSELVTRADLTLLNLGTLVDDLCENIAPRKASHVRLVRDIDIGIHIVGEVTLLSRALVALLTDALERAPKNTQVKVRLAAVHSGNGQREAVLSVSHRGQGPPPSSCTRLYQRFADGAVVDSGDVGFALLSKVALLHRARVRFDSAAGQESSVRFTVKLAEDPSIRTDL